jgi:hypothetical protein
MAEQPVEAFPAAVVIGGMHRSGTSLTASILDAAGIHLGTDLMPAAASNPRGHYEDLEFYKLHQRILAANGLSTDGFTCQEVIDVPAALRAEAVELVRRRRSAGLVWGWKDPRTVLVLDFWAELVPEARWLFVVRPPEDVVDSLFRRGDPAFVFHPRHAVDIWVTYNRRILDFARRHPTRALVVDLARVVTDPGGLVTAVADLLDANLATPEQRYEPGLLTSGQPARRAGLVHAVGPQARDLHRQLLRLTGAGDAAPPDRDPSVAATAEAGLAEWVLGCRALAERAVHAARAAEAIQIAERLERDLAAERVARSEATSRGAALAADLAWLRAEHVEESRCRAAAEARSVELEQERAAMVAAGDAVTARCLALAAELAAASESMTALHTAEAAAKTAHERELAAARQRLADAEASRDHLKRVVTDRDLAIRRLEAAVAEARALAEQARHEAHSLAGERVDLVAQLEAERAIYESLRQDMTGRIEAVTSGRGRVRSAV